MKIDKSESLLNVVQSLQHVVEAATRETPPAIGAAPTSEAVRHQAEAVGLDPVLAEAVYLRIRRQMGRAKVQSEVHGISESEIADALLGLLLEGDPGARRMALWARARAALRDSAGQLGRAFEDMHAVVEETGMGYRPTMHELSEEVANWLKQATRADADGLAVLAQQAAVSGNIEPWKASLIAAWLRSERGRSGRPPTERDLEDLLLNGDAVRVLRATGDGPWDILARQAEMLRSHRNVGQALDDLAVLH